MIHAMSDMLRHGRSLLLVALILIAATGGWTVSLAAEDAAAQQSAADQPTPAKTTPAQTTQVNTTQVNTTQVNTTQVNTTQVNTTQAKTGAEAQVPSKRDRLELDPSVVTGNRELPKVMYIVPWKKAGPGDLPAQPFNTLLDEALTPVDRDVFRREVTYYGAVSATANSADDSSPPVARRPEK